MSVFLFLLARSSLGKERTRRLFMDNDPHGLQVQVDHLIQEMNALKSETNREISYLKSQLATQGKEISSCRVNITLRSLRRSSGWFLSRKRKQQLNLSYFFIFLSNHRFSLNLRYLNATPLLYFENFKSENIIYLTFSVYLISGIGESRLIILNNYTCCFLLASMSF